MVAPSRSDLVAGLVRSLTDARGASCGEMHVHKAAFVAQELLGVPFDLRWKLNKYGPYSSELPRTLKRCEAEGRLWADVGETGVTILPRPDDRRNVLAAEFQSQLQLVSRRVGPMTLDQLEKFSAAAWVTRFPEGWGLTVRARAAHVHAIKPHIDLDTARRAVVYLDDFLATASDEAERDTSVENASAAVASELASVVVRIGLFHRRVYFERLAGGDPRRFTAQVEQAATRPGCDSMPNAVSELVRIARECGYRRVAR